MNEHNKEVEKFLSYYYNLPLPPEYAVMLKGRWGSGKTWFIQKSLEKFESHGGKHLYISLYGISNTEQIEQEFFRQLHPLLSSKGATLAGKILKGLVKGTLKIDLYGDTRDDGTAAIGIPDINIPEYLRNTNGLVLVFDDLERCSLPINEILGYINYFVEHDGYKVIVVANEDEILAREGETETASEYTRIKEKLIGKSLEITPELSDAIATFLNEVDAGFQQRILTENMTLIQEMYIASKYKNLRHLRQALLDYARLLEMLDSEVRKSGEALTHLLTMFLIYSFEIKSGTLRPEDIESIRTSAYASASPKKDEQQITYSLLSRKYTGTNLLDSLLSASLWKEIFSTGLFNAKEINEAIKNSRHFVKKNQPDWVKLWNAHSLPDNELETLLSIVNERFIKNEYRKMGVMRHVVGTLLMLSEIGIFKRTKTDILKTAYANIEHMKIDGTLREEFESDLDFLRDTGYAGLAYHQAETKEFMDFSKALEKCGKEAVEQGYPEKAKELLRLMKENTRNFCRTLVFTNDPSSSKYYSIPILKYVEETEFLATIEELHSEQLNLINGAIQERYSLQFSKDSLRAELPWLIGVSEKLDKIVTQRTGKMSGIHLKYLRENFKSAVNKLQS